MLTSALTSALAVGSRIRHSPGVNPKRLILALAAVFAGIFATNFLIHGVWLQNTYKETAGLWRSEAEMQAHMGWLMLGQFIMAATFVVVWAKGFADTACIRCACMYGLFMGLFSQAATLITYAVQPFPASIAAKWFLSGLAQGVLIGVLVFLVYKPKLKDGKPHE